jgi:hypothetical protein
MYRTSCQLVVHGRCAYGCVLELGLKPRVRAGLSSDVQPRRCPSATSLVGGYRQTIF